LTSSSEPQEIVKIMVSRSGSSEGDELQTFQVYKSVLCRQSPFFAAAFEGGFAEGLTQSMTLEDVNEKEFGSFVDWLHSKELRSQTTQPLSAETMFKLWKLGDRFLVPRIQNEVMKILHAAAKRSHTDSDFFKAMVSHCEGSPILQQFTSDALLCYEKHQLLETVLQVMKLDMTKELVDRLKGLQGKKNYRMPHISTYYVKTGNEGGSPERPEPRDRESTQEYARVQEVTSSRPSKPRAPRRSLKVTAVPRLTTTSASKPALKLGLKRSYWAMESSFDNDDLRVSPKRSRGNET
jgi:hypothetical protein